MIERPLLRADARANRIRIIEAAHQVFRERGLDAEMKEIAERAGVGAGTLYRNFPTRDDLVTAMWAEVTEKFRAAFATALPVEDPCEAIRTLMRNGLAVVDYYGDLSTVLHESLPHHKLAADKSEMFAPVMEVVRRLIAAGVFRPEIDPEIATAAISCILAPWSYRRLRAIRTHDEIVEHYTDMALHSLLQKCTTRHQPSRPARRSLPAVSVAGGLTAAAPGSPPAG